MPGGPGAGGAAGWGHMAELLKGSGQPTGPTELPQGGGKQCRYPNPRQSQYPSDLGQRAGFLCRGEKQEMRRGGEGRPPGRWGERYPRNTAVPANVLQQSCRDPGLQMHRWGCWLAAPLLGPRGSTCGPHPRLPKNPEAWPGLARPPTRPLPPHPRLGGPRPRDSALALTGQSSKRVPKESGERPGRRRAQS